MLSIAQAALFGDSPEVERRKKRQDDLKKQRENKVRGPQKPKKKAQSWFGGEVEEDPDKPIDKAGIQDILADKDIIDTITAQDNPKLKDEEIYKIWEENMHDFVPEDLTNFIVEGSSATVLYEDIGHESPTTVKGAYYVHGSQDAKPVTVFV